MNGLTARKTTTVLIRFVSGDDWGSDTVTGTLKSLDDDVVQIEVAFGDALKTLFVPWRAIRSMDTLASVDSAN